jgi:formylglycine-generating enzyme required for sulfatase activity
MGDGRAAMHWNNGNGDFTRIVADGGWVQGYKPGLGPVSSWGDFDGDGFLDAFLNFGSPDTPRLLHNNGDRTFTFVADSVLNLLDDQTQVSAAVDYDNDGDPDLVLVRYGGQPTRFYQNDGHGYFEEATPEPIRSELTHSLMAPWGDIDNDGDLDVIFGGWNRLSERFYVNNGDGTFTRWAGQPALFESYENQFGSWNAWGDFDNDGYLDLAGGKATSANWLWRNQGDGTFTRVVGEEFGTESGSFNQSGSWVDFNEDGNLDLFVATLEGGKDKLFMGNGNGNGWLEVKLRGVASNRLAVGARIFATATIRGQIMRQMRVITASDNDQTLIAHFGLGDAAQVDLLRIEWPSGIVQELKDVTPNRILTVTEPPRLIPQGVGKFQIQCWVNQSFEVQCSSDLTTWTPVATVTNLTGTFIFEDVEADQHDCRYYRVTEARPNMAWIPAGTFMMGSPEDEVDRLGWEGPQTAVTISRGYWLGKYEVTQREYEAVMGNNPSWFNGVREVWDEVCQCTTNRDFGTDLTRPVETVSWEDAVAYCAALTERERAAGRISANSVYRLPTEAEWEYACRGWTSTRFSYGDDLGYTNLTNYAWYWDNSDYQTHPAGQKLPNPWGLHDMHGNVWEWCQDWWGDYAGGIALDPQGPDTGSPRVIRGGYWGGWGKWGYAGYCRSANRGYFVPDDGSGGIGFRAVLAPGQ